MRHRVILDVCAGTGAWSEPYREAGYTVVRIDLPTDVRLLEYPARAVAQGIHGILAAPPCNKFAYSGARWVKSPADMIEALSIVDACLRLVLLTRPQWWALENAKGSLDRYLGPPVWRCDPFEFGDPWSKRMWLWGSFKPPIFTTSVDPLFHPTLAPGDSRDRTSMFASSNTKERARTSSAFARAFFEANP